MLCSHTEHAGAGSGDTPQTSTAASGNSIEHSRLNGKAGVGCRAGLGLGRALKGTVSSPCSDGLKKIKIKKPKNPPGQNKGLVSLHSISIWDLKILLKFRCSVWSDTEFIISSYRSETTSPPNSHILNSTSSVPQTCSTSSPLQHMREFWKLLDGFVALGNRVQC